MTDDDHFARWWASNKGRAPTPEDREEYETAKAMWNELWSVNGHFSTEVAVPEAPEKTYNDGLRDCAYMVLQKVSPFFWEVWDKWLRTQVTREKLYFRALRSKSEHEFLVAKMKTDGIATLDNVDWTICEVRTNRRSEDVMRHDYRAAEAFATLLTALPSLIELREDLERILGVRRSLEPVAPFCPQCNSSDMYGLPTDVVRSEENVGLWFCGICENEWSDGT